MPRGKYERKTKKLDTQILDWQDARILVLGQANAQLKDEVARLKVELLDAYRMVRTMHIRGGNG